MSCLQVPLKDLGYLERDDRVTTLTNPRIGHVRSKSVEFISHSIINSSVETLERACSVPADVRHAVYRRELIACGLGTLAGEARRRDGGPAMCSHSYQGMEGSW